MTEESGGGLERFKRRLERLRAHHNRCAAFTERVMMEGKSTQQGTETLRGKNLNMLHPSVCGDSPTSTSVSQRKTKKGVKRGREVDEDGFSDLFSPKKKPAQSSEDGDSDVDDQSRRASQANRPSPKRKKRGNPTTKSKETSRIIMKRTWQEEERRAVNKRLGKFMAEHRVPGKLDCVKCLEEEEALKDRTWKDIKYFVHNTIVTLKRRSAARKIMF